MLDLDSLEWTKIRASAGGNGELTAKILKQLYNGDDSEWEELYHQLCHQNTVGETAFVAVPHLVLIAGKSDSIQLKVTLLGTIGSVVASRKCYPNGIGNLRDEWQIDFNSACDDARNLSAEILKHPDLSAEQSFQLISTLAALHGHYNLALLLDSGLDIYCPECGEYIIFGECNETS